MLNNLFKLSLNNVTFYGYMVKEDVNNRYRIGKTLAIALYYMEWQRQRPDKWTILERKTPGEEEEEKEEEEESSHMLWWFNMLLVFSEVGFVCFHIVTNLLRVWQIWFYYFYLLNYLGNCWMQIKYFLACSM